VCNNTFIYLFNSSINPSHPNMYHLSIHLTIIGYKRESREVSRFEVREYASSIILSYLIPSSSYLSSLNKIIIIIIITHFVILIINYHYHPFHNHHLYHINSHTLSIIYTGNPFINFNSLSSSSSIRPMKITKSTWKDRDIKEVTYDQI